MLSLSNPEHRAGVSPWYALLHPLLRITVVWCIFSFKIFLISYGEAGLRPDDLLILASLVVLLLAGWVQQTPISLPLRLYLVYVAIELVSALWNSMQGRVGLVYSLVFVIRLQEYMIFYFIGYALARSGFRLFRVAVWYIYTLYALIPLQMLGLVPVPGTFGIARASGNTNGPYELAVVCGFLLCFVAYRKRSVLLGTGLVALVILTASRITLIATVLSLLHFAVTRTRSIGKVIAVALTLALLGGALYSISALDIVHIEALDRLENSNSLGLAEAKSVYETAPTARSSAEYMEGTFENIDALDLENFNGDLSGLIRFTRWLTLLKANLAHVDSIILGLGPSFGSAAVDGYYTRCYVETGLVGLGAFLAFLASMLFTRRGSSWNFRDYVLIMTVSALFIDVFLSYKSMLLLWLWHGMNQYRRREPETEHGLERPTLGPVMLETIPSPGTAGA